MNDDKKCCGTCAYCHPEKHEDDRRKKEWVCDNAESDNWGQFTNYDDCCVDYVRR